MEIGELAKMLNYNLNHLNANEAVLQKMLFSLKSTGNFSAFLSFIPKMRQSITLYGSQADAMVSLSHT